MALFGLGGAVNRDNLAAVLLPADQVRYKWVRLQHGTLPQGDQIIALQQKLMAQFGLGEVARLASLAMARTFRSPHLFRSGH